jgi:hypothetical protein
MFSPWEEKKALLRLNAEAEARKGWAALTEYNRRRQLARRGHYDPNQPRVPAGHPDGGQWTRTGVTVSGPYYADAGSRRGSSQAGQVRSDAIPDPLRAWHRYAEAVVHDPDDVLIKITRDILHDILSHVNGSVAHATYYRRVPEWLYGIMVHTAFAREVRARNLMGIGVAGVEQSFNMVEIVYYGARGIRTDVVLRNHEGRIIAIFDVKTGNATMEPAREADIRRHTGVGPHVPVIIMRAVRPY